MSMLEYIASGLLQAILLLQVGKLHQDPYLAVLAGRLVLVGRTHNMLPGYHEISLDLQRGKE
jgi:hypothetical protein